MFGVYDNFPPNIHLIETYNSALSKKASQECIIQTIQQINRKNLTFEEIGSPTIPNSTVILEIGIADGHSFTFMDKEETQKILNLIENQSFNIMDFFCVNRYYKNTSPKRTALKFDYYMIRVIFGKERLIEFQLFHEHGPRYLSPQDLLSFIVRKAHSGSSKKILKLIKS